MITYELLACLCLALLTHGCLVRPLDHYIIVPVLLPATSIAWHCMTLYCSFFSHTVLLLFSLPILLIFSLNLNRYWTYGKRDNQFNWVHAQLTPHTHIHSEAEIWRTLRYNRPIGDGARYSVCYSGICNTARPSQQQLSSCFDVVFSVSWRMVSKPVHNTVNNVNLSGYDLTRCASSVLELSGGGVGGSTPSSFYNPLSSAEENMTGVQS